MNHGVPDFDMDDDCSIPASSSSISRQKAEDDIMELLWQDGQVVAQSQTQRTQQKSPGTSMPSEPHPPQPPPGAQLYIAEDEMATWLHYPLEDLCTDLLYSSSTPPPPPPSSSQTLAQSSTAVVVRPTEVHIQQPTLSRPPVPPPRNFPHFSRYRGRAPAPSTGLTVVESNKMPAAGKSTEDRSVGEVSAAMSRAPPCGGSGDLTVCSSTSGSGTGSGSGSGTSGAAPATTTAAADAPVEGGERKEAVVEDRKRKGQETDEVTVTTTACHTEDVEHESADEKRHSRGSAAKRSRAAEVHNLSERRRRDRINEKMRALQELIPRCNKSDKASMLDEAIEYLKSLQMQVQMMSMGCGMVPMIYPGMQQYMPLMGMGMGMGMGVDTRMSRPMASFPTAVPACALPTTPGGSVVFTTPAANAAPQVAPRFPVPAFPMPPVPQPAVPRMQASNPADSVRNPVPLQSSGMPQLANLADPYQQYFALQQMQMQMQMQSQSISQPVSSKPSSSKPSTSMSEEDFDDSQCG